MAALSEAYDLSVFEVQEEVLQPKLKVTENRAAAAEKIPAYAIALAAVAIAAIVMMIFMQVKISETSAQVSAARAQLDVLENENRMLKNQLESSLSLRAIEEQAMRTYGMSAAEDYQLEYVALNSGDSIRIKQDKKTSFMQDTAEKVGNFLEYIELR